MKPENELNARTVLLGCLLCAVAAAATPYVTLKLGQSVDLTMGGCSSRRSCSASG
jgi:hypothetical protein